MFKKSSQPKKITTPQYGAEIEMPIIDQETGKSASIPDDHFQKLAKLKAKKSENIKNLDQVLAGENKILTATGEYETDNGKNLLETAFQPTNNLHKLNDNIIAGLQDTMEILAQYGLTIANIGEHPNQATIQKFYEETVAKKPVYSYIATKKGRNWSHKEGIDAKAQNSPSTEVAPQDIVEAANAMFFSSFATIALTANSPFEAGKITGNKANRLTLWDRMFKTSHYEGDRKTSQFPKKPFSDIADYWNWMHGEGTSMHFVLRSGSTNDYKHNSDYITINEDHTNLLDYLSKPEHEAHYFNSGKLVRIQPEITDLEIQQFAQFSASRIRYKFNKDASIELFQAACKNKKLQEWFNQNVQYCYIEGRDAEANFPDAELKKEEADVYNSVIIAPSALQKGIIQNAAEINRLITWEKAIELRQKAIGYGLADEEVYNYTQKVFDIASEALPAEEQKLLAYFDFCLRTKANGADRAIAMLKNMPGNTDGEKMLELAKQRKIILE